MFDRDVSAQGRLAQRTPSADSAPDRPVPIDDAVPRPVPPVGVLERATAWLQWFGPARLAATVVSVVAVAAGAYWLVRAPAPSAEAVLPTPTSIAAPVVTLPPPVPETTTVPVVDPPPTEIVVHVAGAVVAPGVYEVPGDGRVADAIERAGGAAAEADLDAVNLAQILADGQRLFVPERGTVDHASTPVLWPPAGSSNGAVGDPPSAEPAGPIDMNRAGVTELEELPGIGPATARAIVDERERNGPFVSVDDLERVPGVGPAKVAALRDLVIV